MICPICMREGDARYFEKHRLFPVRTRRTSDEGIMVCHNCADQIHLMFTNQQLQRDLHTLMDLKIAMTSYVEWVQDKPIETHFSMAKKKRHN